MSGISSTCEEMINRHEVLVGMLGILRQFERHMRIEVDGGILTKFM